MNDPLVTAAQLTLELGSPNLRILDCTVGSEIHADGGYSLCSGWKAWEAGHIPGSRHVDLLGDLSDRSTDLYLMMPPSEHVASVMASLGVGDRCRLVLYDSDMNMWAARLWWMLRTVGFEAFILDGGWSAWTAEQLPREVGPGMATEPAVFTPGEPLDVFTDRHGVLASLSDQSVCLVDALQPEVFSGRRSDYGRPGHIPGAINVPFADLVDPATHRYLPLDELRRLLAGALAAGRVITYCGGGVAASSAALTLQRLGVGRVSVYDGSLIEWARDPALPMVVGG